MAGPRAGAPWSGRRGAPALAQQPRRSDLRLWAVSQTCSLCRKSSLAGKRFGSVCVWDGESGEVSRAVLGLQRPSSEARPVAAAGVNPGGSCVGGRSPSVQTRRKAAWPPGTASPDWDRVSAV